mgnify:CR=1 FL=1
MDTTYSNNIWILLIVLVAFVLLAVVALPDIQLGTHAVLRHGNDAVLARQAVMASGGTCCRPCADGRTRCICGLGDGRFAIQILEGGTEITAFIADRDYAKTVSDQCGPNPWAHP